MFLLFAAMQVKAATMVRATSPIDPSSWITTNDYPTDAVTLHQEGSVAFEVAVDSTGAVTDCIITASSGIALLDNKTCELIRGRGHFTPASGATGQPIAGRYRSRVNWTLPSQNPADETLMLVKIASGTAGYRCSVAYPAADVPWADPRCEMIGAALARESRSFPTTVMESFKGSSAAATDGRTSWVMSNDYPADALRNHWQGKSRYLLDIDASGHVTKCTITLSAGYKSLDDATCRIMTARAKFSPAKGSGGAATASHYANSINWQIPDR